MGLSSERAARIDAKDGSLAQIFCRSFSNNDPARVFSTVGTFDFRVQWLVGLLRRRGATRRPGK